MYDAVAANEADTAEPVLPVMVTPLTNKLPVIETIPT
jgi:hypothetical protein